MTKLHPSSKSPATALEAHLGAYQKAVDAALDEMAREEIIARIWKHDHTVWKPQPDEITNRLGWLHIADAMQENLPRLENLVEEVRADGYSQVLLLGMGGSSLAPHVFSKVFAAEDGLALAVLDTTDPGAVLARAAQIDLAQTLFIVASKSGSTAETISLFKFFYNRALEEFGEERAGEHFVAITDPGSKLVGLGEKLDFRAVLLNDPNIGGRYSALSYFGLAPAALVGLDLERLLEGAQAMASDCRSTPNPASELGAILGELARAGRDKVTFVASDKIAPFGDWLEQLIAESTGKSGTGILPVVGEPLGPAEVYGDDRLFVHLQLGADETHAAALIRLEKAGHPLLKLILRDVYDLGEQMFLWELAVAVAGYRLGIQPFDQPNVEAAKVQARRMMAEYREKGKLPDTESAPLTSAALHDFLAQAGAEGEFPRDYIALQAYVQPTPATTESLQNLRIQLRDRYRLATTVGYGPRFLHSTGQLHKGDAGNGLFVQFTADNPSDAAIPEEADASGAHITFGVLEMAQAMGDRQALRDAGRRVIHFHLGEDVIGGLRRLAGGA
jgi:transaldolase / glucose-6-phosphate isomerase